MKSNFEPKIVYFDSKRHLPQNSSEKTNDLFYILMALYLAEEQDKNLTTLTLEKSLFKTSFLEAKQGKKFFNTFFFIDKNGTHNNVFYKYLAEMEAGNLLNKSGRDIKLRAKGSSLAQQFVQVAQDNNEIKDLLIKLDNVVGQYADNPSKAWTENHQIKAVDYTTKEKKTKTIEEVIKEMKQAHKFASIKDFKYFDYLSSDFETIDLPSRYKNNLEDSLSNIELEDYKTAADISTLFISH